MALKPLGDRIVVRFEETEEKTASGFVLAGASHEATKTAEVLAVGEGIRTLTGELIAPSVAAGDKVLVENGMQLSGISPDGRIVEMIELKNHPWFIATQAHPELKSRPNRPHPLFRGFITAALEYQNKNH